MKSARWILGGALATSFMFFILATLNPIMGTELLLGIKRDEIFLIDSIKYFFSEGEVTLGVILLLFTFIFPILKYLYLSITLANFKIRGQERIGWLLEIINKWAMLDVFVVALIIVNMKFDRLIISSSLRIGTTFFAISVLLIMICSYGIKKWLVDSKE